MCGGGHGVQALTRKSSSLGKTRQCEPPTDRGALRGSGLGHPGIRLLWSTTAPSPEQGKSGSENLLLALGSQGRKGASAAYRGGRVEASPT